MSTELTILAIISVPLCLYALYLLYSMPYKMMENLEKEVEECVKKRDKEFEERQEFIKEMKKWMFKSR